MPSICLSLTLDVILKTCYIEQLRDHPSRAFLFLNSGWYLVVISRVVVASLNKREPVAQLFTLKLLMSCMRHCLLFSIDTVDRLCDLYWVFLSIFIIFLIRL